MDELSKDHVISALIKRLNKHEPGVGDSILDSAGYHNYVTESEYLKIVPQLKNQDGSIGAKYSHDFIRNALKKVSGTKLDCSPYYNEFALFLTINKIMADNYKFITEVAGKIGILSVLVCYDLAVGALKSEVRPKWVREDFNLD